MIEALLFDMDGLMIESESLYWQAERDIARRHGAEVQESTLRRMMGRRPIESMACFREDLDLKTSAAELLAERDAVMLGLLRTTVQTQPGLFELLDRFAHRLRYAVVTGAPAQFAAVVLARFELEPRFELVQSSDEVRRGKPDPEIYLTAMQRMDLKPEACVVLEDSANGVRAGNAAGCRTVAVPDQHSRDDDFSAADVVVADLFAAADHIQGLLE